MEKGDVFFCVKKYICLDIVLYANRLSIYISQNMGQSQTKVFEATKSGNIELLKELLRRKYNVNIQDEKGYTPLLYASSRGYTKIVRLLLKGGANPNYRMGKFGTTALTLASAKGYIHIVRLLMDAGADPYIRTNKGSTALALASERGRKDIVHLIIQSSGPAILDIQNTNGSTALMIASRMGRLDIVRILLRAGADPDIQEKGRATALILASRYGHMEIVELLLLPKKEGGGNANPNIQGHYGRTALMGVIMDFRPTESTRNNRFTILRILLHAGSDPNIQDTDGDTALTLAYTHRYEEELRKDRLLDIMYELLEAGANTDIKNKLGRSIFDQVRRSSIRHRLGYDPDWKRVIRLLEHFRRGEHDMSNAIIDGDIEKVRRLISDGYDVNEGLLVIGAEGSVSDIMRRWSMKEMTPLQLATTMGSKDIIQLLLSKGAKVDGLPENVEKSDRKTPFLIAYEYQEVDIARILIENGADVIEEVFHYLDKIDRNIFKLVQWILDNEMVDVYTLSKRGISLLGYACAVLDAPTVEYLLSEKGADANMKIFYGEAGYLPPLLVATVGYTHRTYLEKEYMDIVDKLISYGADKDATTNNRKITALMYLILYSTGNTVISFLIDKGVDVTLRDANGKTALDHAIDQGNGEIIRLLLDLEKSEVSDPEKSKVSTQPPNDIHVEVIF